MLVQMLSEPERCCRRHCRRRHCSFKARVLRLNVAHMPDDARSQIDIIDVMSKAIFSVPDEKGVLASSWRSWRHTHRSFSLPQQTVRQAKRRQTLPGLTMQSNGELDAAGSATQRSRLPGTSLQGPDQTLIIKTETDLDRVNPRRLKVADQDRKRVVRA